MVEGGEHLRLALEALGRGAPHLLQHLERHGPVEPPIQRAIHDADASGAELALHEVALAEVAAQQLG